MTCLLSLHGLAKSCFGIPANRDVSFSVREGSVLGIIGQNGAGKSTLMNMIGGVVKPTAGYMLWRGLPYEPAGAADATRIGIAFIRSEERRVGKGCGSTLRCRGWP